MTFSGVQTLMFQSWPFSALAHECVSAGDSQTGLENAHCFVGLVLGGHSAMPHDTTRITRRNPWFSRILSVFHTSLLGTFRAAAVHAMTTTARPDTGHPSPCSSEHRHFAIARSAADSDSDVRDAILRYVAPRLVRRGHDGPGPRISGQALAAIILCATILLCALLGCLMQIPVLCPPCLRDRLLRSAGSTSSAGSLPSSSSGSMPGSLDVEMGDQPVSLANGASPPPPYTRAPSYESSGSAGGRGDRTS